MDALSKIRAALEEMGGDVTMTILPSGNSPYVEVAVKIPTSEEANAKLGLVAAALAEYMVENLAVFSDGPGGWEVVANLDVKVSS